MGKWIVDNCTVNAISRWKLCGVGYANYGTGNEYLDYGRVLNTPDLMSITNVSVNIPSTCTFYPISMPVELQRTNEINPIGQTYINNIQNTGGVGKIVEYYQ